MKRLRILKNHDVPFNQSMGFGNVRAYKKSDEPIDVLEADVQALLDAGAAEHVEAHERAAPLPRESRKKD